jgi:uncharacterized membrane protein YvbJ
MIVPNTTKSKGGKGPSYYASENVHEPSLERTWDLSSMKLNNIKKRSLVSTSVIIIIIIIIFPFEISKPSSFNIASGEIFLSHHLHKPFA